MDHTSQEDWRKPVHNWCPPAVIRAIFRSQDPYGEGCQGTVGGDVPGSRSVHSTTPPTGAATTHTTLAATIKVSQRRTQLLALSVGTAMLLYLHNPQLLYLPTAVVSVP